MMKRAAVYVRVSTEKQNAANQLPELKALAARRGLDVVRVYEEMESGAKRRPVLEGLCVDAAGGAFDVVLVWALDRLGRGGALEALTLIQMLDRHRVAVVSARESWLDTSGDNPMRDVLIAFSATIAKMERARLIERTKAGIDERKRKGGWFGRPSVVRGSAGDEEVSEEVRKKRAALNRAVDWHLNESILGRSSLRATAKLHRVSVSSLSRALAARQNDERGRPTHPATPVPETPPGPV